MGPDRIQIYALDWPGNRTPCRFRGPTLFFVGGPVSPAVPIVVAYRGSKARAIDVKQRLKRKGFRNVTLEYQRKVSP